MNVLRKISESVFLILMTLFVFSCTPGGDIFDDDKESSDTGVENNGTSSGDDKGNVHKGHEWVDLGLPSGIKWATCNVGATKPEEYGGYYAWGEIEERDEYNWHNYKWGDANGKYTKYCSSPLQGVVDNKMILEPEDDVAHVEWGGKWRMPTGDETLELSEECIWDWTSLNDVKGMLVTGPNGNSIFLPAAGCYYSFSLVNEQNRGYYWSSSLVHYNSGHPFTIYFSNGNSHNCLHDYLRSNNGFTVRPVCE